jgi:hypothetical protein
MKAYTVILLRPDQEGFEDIHDRLYVATQVVIEPTGQKYADACRAVKAAQFELWESDKREYEDNDAEFLLKPADYEMLYVFEGHHEPVYIGFQTGEWSVRR